MSAANTGAAVRAEAARAVDAVVTRGRSLDDALSDADARTAVADRPLLRMLSYGTLRTHWRLKSFAEALLDRPLKPRDSVIDSLIAVGLFQLSESRIPDHAAVSLTVDAARRLRRPKYAPVINAVLRNFRRERLMDRDPPDEESRFNHPAWLIERLKADWPEHWRQILQANNARAPMWLRVNRTRTTAGEYLAELERPGMPVRENAAERGRPATLAGFDQAIRLAEPEPVTELPGFAAGLVSVQDAAAQLAAPWLLMDGGRRILDACAAPGGKAAHLLELSGPGASLTALDLDAGRLARVGDNLGRLGLSATLKAADASKPDEWWDGELFDRILLDAPCSATGVIRRHPDIKLLRREADIEQSARLQLSLLSALWPLLAAGGRLLYVTCSVLAEENEAVVGEFLRQGTAADEEQVLPNYNIRDLMCRKKCGYQILPGIIPGLIPGDQDLDGFYFACLRKQA
ncbi:MAG: 16S rRNA (cytosine(967)-C(5))-methyltransferase RsmB [Woeseia sp.]